MGDKLSRAKEIIDFCLKPLAAQNGTDEYKQTYQRLEHVIKTYQAEILKEKRPVAIDFSQMRTNVINEDAHGDGH